MRGLIGVIHLPALPGDPGYAGAGLEPILDAARRDAEALQRGGAGGIIIENFGSAPFFKGSADDRLPAHVIALMTRAVLAVADVAQLPLGVNCLRNDARAALGIAKASGAVAVRINVHTGAAVTDQGIIEGEAAQTLRYRDAIDAKDVKILADVLVKHARPMGSDDPVEVTREALGRGKADAVIVTGAATGAPIDVSILQAVRSAAADGTVLLGSGVRPDNCQSLGPFADGAIVGTWLKEDGDIRQPVDSARVQRLCDALLPHLRGA